MPDPISAIAGSGVLGAGASLFGANAQANAANRSADIQRAAADKSIAAQREMYDIGRADLAPYRETGVEAQNQLRSFLGLGGDVNAPGYGRYAKDFSMSDFTEDPGYAFRLSEGMKGLNAQAAARGGMISGAALKAATNYGQQAGSQEYTNAFNRYQTNRAAQLDPLFKLYGGGQASAAGSAAQAQALGQNLGSTYTNLGSNVAQAGVAAGNAMATGGYNAANALTNAANQGTSSYMMNNYLNRLGGGGSNLSFLPPSQGGLGLI
jgi:hypothetical protein